MRVERAGCRPDRVTPLRRSASEPDSAASATRGSSPCTFRITSNPVKGCLAITSAARSVPDCGACEVMTASNPARSTTATISSASVATTTRSHTRGLGDATGNPDDERLTCQRQQGFARKAAGGEPGRNHTEDRHVGRYKSRAVESRESRFATTKKFCSKRLPCSVPMDSGWNCTPKDRVGPVPHGHDLGALGSVGAPRGDLQLLGERLVARRRASDTACRSPGSESLRTATSCVVHHAAGLAVHQSVGPHDFAAERLADRLVAETDAEDRESSLPAPSPEEPGSRRRTVCRDRERARRPWASAPGLRRR